MSLNTFAFIPPYISFKKILQDFRKKEHSQNSYILVRKTNRKLRKNKLRNNDEDESSCGMGMNEVSYVGS